MAHLKISSRKHIDNNYGYLENENGLHYEVPKQVLISFLRMKSDIVTKDTIINLLKERIKELESNTH